MTEEHAMRRKKEPKLDPLEEGQPDRRQAEPEQTLLQPGLMPDQAGLQLLHDQIGNLAVQQLLTQDIPDPAIAADAESVAQIFSRLDPAEPEAEVSPLERPLVDPEAGRDAGEPVAIGLVLFRKPKVEYYDIKAGTLEEALAQREATDRWVEQLYQPDLTTEAGRVIEANIVVMTRVFVPRWTGAGWEAASAEEQAQWFQETASFQIDRAAQETGTELPQNLLLGPLWETAPEALKADWRSFLQSAQAGEQDLFDTAQRRAVVLQQRLINQPDQQVNHILEQFLADVEKEEQEYTTPDQVAKTSLSGKTLVQ